ncbi:hypothetical protein ACOCJ4_14350 [Knoellia sp. CPCC 206435]|uniref:hypothetical protein n=1 Tax=Knoellia terrae TaxID=3404797 RepID=UPI003B432B24
MTQPSSGFRLTPLPHYTRTTPGGSRVTCGGCCLPLPLGCLVGVVALGAPAVLGLVRRRVLHGA